MKESTNISSNNRHEQNNYFRFTAKGCMSLSIILFGMFVGGIIGLFAASFIIGNKIYPYWHKTEIYPENLVIKEISSLDVNYQHFGNKFHLDKLFIITNDNKPYVFTQNQWQPISLLPNDLEIENIWINYKEEQLASSTNGRIFILKNERWIPYESQLIDPFSSSSCGPEWGLLPPINQSFIDSEGVWYGHDPIEFLRCYILFEDGHLEIWSYHIHISP